MTSKEAREWASLNIQTIRPLYLDADMTAAQIAEKFGIHYDNNFQKGLFRELGPKGKGLGGARVKSGNRKVKKPRKPARMPGMQITEEVRQIIAEAPKKYGVSQSDFVAIAVQLIEDKDLKECKNCGCYKLPHTEIAGLDPDYCDGCGSII